MKTPRPALNEPDSTVISVIFLPRSLLAVLKVVMRPLSGVGSIPTFFAESPQPEMSMSAFSYLKIATIPNRITRQLQDSTIGRPHCVGFRPAICFQASSPIFEPSPETGEANPRSQSAYFNQHRIPRRVHTGGNRPDHIIPVACVNVIIANDNKFRIHKLKRKTRSDAHHDAFRMTSVLLFIFLSSRHYRRGKNTLPAADNDDFRKTVFLQNRHELRERHLIPQAHRADAV